MAVIFFQVDKATVYLNIPHVQTLRLFLIILLKIHIPLFRMASSGRHSSSGPVGGGEGAFSKHVTRAADHPLSGRRPRSQHTWDITVF